MTQPTAELCRLYHGIDCRRGCVPSHPPAGTVIDIPHACSIKIFARALPSGAIQLYVEEL